MQLNARKRCRLRHIVTTISTLMVWCSLIKSRVFSLRRSVSHFPFDSPAGESHPLHPYLTTPTCVRWSGLVWSEWVIFGWKKADRRRARIQIPTLRATDNLVCCGLCRPSCGRERRKIKERNSTNQTFKKLVWSRTTKFLATKVENKGKFLVVVDVSLSPLSNYIPSLFSHVNSTCRGAEISCGVCWDISVCIKITLSV